MVWNDTEGLRLIQREYPWFVPHLRQFKSGVEKADIMRYFILYHHGGIYADLDMEAVSPLCLATPSHMMVALPWGTVSACAPAVSRAQTAILPARWRRCGHPHCLPGAVSCRARRPDETAAWCARRCAPSSRCCVGTTIGWGCARRSHRGCGPF
jgi:hypothetical protein